MGKHFRRGVRTKYSQVSSQIPSPSASLSTWSPGRQTAPKLRAGAAEWTRSFLLSDQTEYINGECVVIDGRLWLRGAGEFNVIDTPDSEREKLESRRG